MDRYLGLSWKRLLHLLFLYFILIYPVQLSSNEVEVDHFNSDEFDNHSSRIKQQKWDTASQGGQEPQSTSVPLVPNTSELRKTPVGRTNMTSNDFPPTSSSSQRIMNFTTSSTIHATTPPRTELATMLSLNRSATGTTTPPTKEPPTQSSSKNSLTDSVPIGSSGGATASTPVPPRPIKEPEPTNTDQSISKSPGETVTNSVKPNSNATQNPTSGVVSADRGPVQDSVFTRQAKEALKWRFHRMSESCDFPCLNGGWCTRTDSCDCSLFQATGHRCQTVPNPGFERDMTCRTWGQYNFETFDGLYYYFPGRCTYTLLRDCDETTQTAIVVQVHNDPDCGSEPYSCQRSVSLFLPWEGEVRLHATNVTFKGQSLQLPHHIHDLHLQQISHNVLVTQPQGFTLAWEGHSGSVYIKLSPEYAGRTCGLCGNFNADPQDDLRTSYGILSHELEMFGNSWMETAAFRPRCPTVLSGFSSPCADVDVNVLLKVEELCLMLLDPPFQSCHDFVNPLSYMASCFNTLCMSGPTSEAVCQAFTEYSRACSHADKSLNDWRDHIPQCAKQCPPGLQYLECISVCPASCNKERTCIDSGLACLDGCYCPNGLIYTEGGCVAPSECPCEHHGIFYQSGQTIQEECNNCTCLAGVWNCVDFSCPGECSVTGDMYFESFDGRVYTFPATCQYVLAKSRKSGKFTVTIQNAPCGANLDGSCIQSINLVIDEDPKMEITLSHIGEVFMAGQYRISLPYSDDIFQIQELSSMFLQVKTTFGLRLQYSWKEFRLYLQANALWKDDTVGLCGTFNGNIQDDFLSPAGMIESTPLLFGNAWRVSSACTLSLTTPLLEPCDTHQQAVAYASEMCDILNQDLFSPCHGYISPVPFHRQCRSDTCKCGTPCFCSAVAHYARHCRRFSVIIDFRSHIRDCVVTCPNTMQYGVCVSSCQHRCSAISSSPHCEDECEEGCVCPTGLFYDERTHTCVRRNECPCTFLGADYEPGDVIMTSAGVQLCVDGTFVLQTADIGSLCPDGQSYHNCSEGQSGHLPGRGVACERTCESHLLNLTCSAHEPCVSGCVCPAGFLKHGDECFEPESCPCLWKGKEYFPGDKVSSPCHQCVCQHGTFQCAFRPCPSMCTTYGDRHYRTFDGLLFDYVGACQVYLLKSSADVILSVTAENVDCFDNGVVCRKSLLINIGRSFVAFDDDTGQPNHSSVIGRNQRMLIWPAGLFTVVQFPEEDVTILWDTKTTIHIQVGPRWQGKLGGLCGNFDSKTANEMRTPDNIDSSTPQEFGNSWTTTECANSPDMRQPCSISPLREPFAKQQCAILLSEVFQACHPVVDVTWFYTNCLSDTCGCSRGGDCECFCTSVAAYAQRCCHQGVPVDWRSPSVCSYDCEFYNKVLGKGPFRLIPFRDRATVLVARHSGSSVLIKRGNFSDVAGTFSHFMMTPGLSRVRPHDTSRISFEAASRPNHFLYVSPGGQLKLAKWEESKEFWDRATFVLHTDTWISGYDSLESQAKPGFFLHATIPRLHLLKYRHSDSFRKAILFRLTGSGPDAPPGPRCQWRYDSCSSPCFKTCSDPSAEACVSIPQVEGCFPFCPPHMVLDEVTRRCVYAKDCIKAPVIKPIIPTGTETTSAILSSTTTKVELKTATVPSISLMTKTTTSPTTSASAPTTPQIPDRSTKLSIPEPTQPVAEPSSTTFLPAVRPEADEPLSTMKVTESDSAAETPTVSPFASSTFSSSRAPFGITSIFWSTDSLQPLVTTKTTPMQTSTGTVPSTRTQESTEGTHSVVVFPFGTTSPVTERTVVPKSTTTAHMETGSTKPLTVEGVPSGPVTPVFRSTASLSTVPVKTAVPMSTVSSAKTVDSVSTVEPVKTRTTQFLGPETTAPLISALTTETILLTTPVSSEIPPLTPVHVSLTTTVPSPTLSVSDLQTPKKTTTILESTESKKPAAVTTLAPVSTATSRPPKVATATTLVTRPTTEPSVPAVASVSPSSTTMTSKPWRLPHWDTSSTWLYRPTAKTTPALTSQGVPHLVSVTKTTEVPRFSVSQPVITSTVPDTLATTTAKTISIPTIEFHTKTKVTPGTGVPDTPFTVVSAGVPPISTTIGPVTVKPVTETGTSTSPATPRTTTTGLVPSVRSTSTATSTTITTTAFIGTTVAGTTPQITSTEKPVTTPSVVTTESRSASTPQPEVPSGTISKPLTPLTAKTPVFGLTTSVAPPLVPDSALTTVTVSSPVTSTTAVSVPKTTEPPIASQPATSQSDIPGLTVTPTPTTATLFTTVPDRRNLTSTLVQVQITRTCTPPYAEIVDECSKYICVNNQLVFFNKSQSCPFSSQPPNCGLLGFAVLVNGDKCCPQWDCPCRCSVFPDLNVITFDGNSVGIHKAASFIAAQQPNETVSVLVQECPAESALLGNLTNLCLVSLNITHNSHHVVINRLQRRLFVNSRYARPRFKKFGFEIYDTGNMYLVRSPAGLKLQWYHSTGMMVIDADNASNKPPTMMGLCGFCDGDPSNDLILPNGTTLERGEDPSLFIDSWQVPNTTSYVSPSRRRQFNCSTSDCSRCLVMLRNPAFFQCHTFVSPSTFCEVWVQDVEYVNNHCVALAAYVASCHKFNICIEWRRPDYCPFTCPDTLRYKACLPVCTSQSCPHPDFDSDPDPDHCSGLTEGCVCPQGTLLHRPYSALCIPPSKCACTDSSGIPRAHGEVWKASKDACCMYRCDKDTVVPVEFNCSTVDAPVCRREGEVVVSLAENASCCPRKVCVCNQTLCDLVPPECEPEERLVSYYRQDSCCPDYECECDPTRCESELPTCRSDQILTSTKSHHSCCLDHICMCSSCTDVPPRCQDGEVLTVDGNATDRCCPIYQCVCEPSRCPHLTCPVGMSAVSVPRADDCCPNQTCECSCDKITPPKCGLGETLQLDGGVVPSDAQNPCGCQRHKCIREAVCVYGERRVLRPGQTLVEHGEDGLCYSRQCSRVLDATSGLHLLRTSSTNCSAHCQLNQMYVPSKEASTCCGVCKNISCLYTHDNGSTLLYKTGKSWMYNCMKFECIDTFSGPTLVSYPFSCPPINETECMKMGGSVLSYMDGCCKTCKEDGKPCQKVTVRMTIRKNDCRSNRPVNIVSCDGKCPSASIYNYNINTYARFCKCCREMGLQRRSVQLYCSGNSTWVSYAIQEPTDCSCQWT
uniref:otogelin-like protein n=1 Tax=Doryrhamphus excisus TaxID=161450 RepID=UPI0025AEA26E|nr:otogelin-like protein [Doryrhamphus excisus]